MALQILDRNPPGHAEATTSRAGDFHPSSQVHAHPLMDRLLKNRGILDASEADLSAARLPDPLRMKGMREAVSLLNEMIDRDGNILVISDYDCDGATACAIAVEGLRELGAKHVGFLVPDRFTYGYGLSAEIVSKASELRPDLIITVDNGIASHAGASAVRSLDHPTKLLITDHHLAPESLPCADVIINPNQPGCEYPSKAIAGCGVIFMALLALKNHRIEQGYYPEGSEPRLLRLLDLLALGTIADVVPLDYVNRTLVSLGLAMINSGRVRPGIGALLKLAKRAPPRIVSSDMGFAVGPRLNAAGRLDDMTIGVRCLLSQDPEEAGELARELDAFNSARKEIEQDMKTSALETLPAIEDLDAYGLCFFNADWHQGVVGIVASRLKELTHRPVICFAPDEEGEVIKGSARSVPGLHLRDALADIDVLAPGLLLKFGGHAMAAGLSIRKYDFERFSEMFDARVRASLSAADIAGSIETDGELEPEYFNTETAELIKHASPWGQGFPEPVFHGEFFVVGQKVVAERHLKLLIATRSGEAPVDGIYFHAIEPGDPVAQYKTVRLVYQLDVNVWRETKKLQLIIRHLEALSSSESESLEQDPPQRGVYAEELVF
ncbi:single-stranded-DNA-specific exonuclease RecJ [Thioalkalivibrio thiocyanodenitrificans]|uniref:single-stranded-DNA-specific exonuclease RecJ n=1 Tax=Thioalkalivibrio thiocyanodenitrificans TaxID=243063 RepID=UPI0018DE20CE|nr:single-stranded-DNA-specific exonuclease RecJ [Thioalkalivibrio thiocyanodenitrificans]